MKAERSRLIPRKPTENQVLLTVAKTCLKTRLETKTIASITDKMVTQK